VNEKVKEYKETKYNSQQDYESVLIKYENDIRGHIKIEHQLKIYIENLQNEIEKNENEKKFLNQIIFDLNNNLNNNMNYQIYKPNKFYEIENEIEILKKDISDKIILIKSYEEQNLKLASNEKKLKSLITLKEKANKEKEEKYKSQIQEINKKIIFYKDLLNKKYNTSINNYNEIYNINQTSFSTIKDEKSNIINSVENSNRKNRNNNISFLSISGSMDKKIQNKITYNKIHSLSNKNIRKENNSNNSSLSIKKNQKDFLNKLFINNTIILSNKKTNGVYNRYKSFENSNKPTKVKNSSIFKDFIINSNNVKFRKEKVRNFKHLRSSSQGKINKNIEFINNINIFTNSIKQDKYNSYRVNSSNGSNKNINRNCLNTSQRNNNKKRVKTSNTLGKIY
jgi:hypothetical protein